MTKRLCGAWIVLLLAVGCQRAPEATYPVSGMVQLDGRPLVLPERHYSGTVVFASETTDARGESYTARGLIASDGSYRLTTFHDGDGAVAGKHRVAVMISQMSEGPAVAAPHVPPAYQSPGTSGIEVEVHRDANRIDLPVQSRP
ncbi:MAG: hypothetical protein U1E05_21695 [Patescibacteria group bacterium]|nr:hypothetical protein [Patescibacteria group bacterium]